MAANATLALQNTTSDLTGGCMAGVVPPYEPLGRRSSTAELFRVVTRLEWPEVNVYYWVRVHIAAGADPSTLYGLADVRLARYMKECHLKASSAGV